VQGFSRYFGLKKQGHFINIVNCWFGQFTFGSFYHATKHGVESFSECMAYELLDFNISVATVQFGNTPSNSKKCNQIKTIYQPRIII
jgi:NAD(P)-dependent dehydrogenase (short-subunit alcohol dehydrogenase family)